MKTTAKQMTIKWQLLIYDSADCLIQVAKRGSFDIIATSIESAARRAHDIAEKMVNRESSSRHFAKFSPNILAIIDDKGHRHKINDSVSLKQETRQ